MSAEISPPILAKNGPADQPTLLGPANALPPAERVFIRLARRWHGDFAAVGPDYAAPRSVDELALSAVLLAREHGASFTSAAWQQAEANIALAEKRAFAQWIDSLPWRLAAAARLSEPSQSRELEELDRHLNHHNSSIRIWMMELALMVRPWAATRSRWRRRIRITTSGRTTIR